MKKVWIQSLWRNNACLSGIQSSLVWFQKIIVLFKATLPCLIRKWKPWSCLTANDYRSMPKCLPFHFFGMNRDYLNTMTAVVDSSTPESSWIFTTANVHEQTTKHCERRYFLTRPRIQMCRYVKHGPVLYVLHTFSPMNPTYSPFSNNTDWERMIYNEWAIFS